MKKIILSLVFIGMLFLVGCQVECPDCVCPEQKECPELEECQVCGEPQIEKGKAILNAEMYGVAFNELDTNEMFFDYWIYNYGDTEAKNVKVKCVLLGWDYNVLKRVVDDYGNLASSSAELGEVVFKKPNSVTLNTELTGICYVVSCSNCEILYKRVPKAVEAYEVTYK